MSVLDEIKDRNYEPILDNDLAYKIINELETWKNKQKEIFKNKLQKREEAYLTVLNQDWQKHCNGLESKLVNNIKQCKILANDLNKTTENLRLWKIQSLKKEIKLIQENEDLNWKYDRKFNHLKNSLQKMQEEFSTKLISLDKQNQNLNLKIKSLNEKKLEKIKSQQDEKLKVYKKAFLMEDQTLSLLQQITLEKKLNRYQKIKSFLKENWDQTMKEINEIKIENQKAINTQIKINKKELHELEKILQTDSTALIYDRIVLNEIQQEIDIINPDMAIQCYHTINTNDQSYIS